MRQTVSTAYAYEHVLFEGKKSKPVVLPGPASTLRPPQGIQPRRSFSVQPPEAEALFCTWLLRRAGIDPDRYRMAALCRRVPACLRALHVASMQSGIQRIEETPQALQTALDALLIGVTRLFRDACVYQSLRSRWLATLTTGRRGPAICSIGCSDGAELYSVAILLSEMGKLEGARLLGIDCREAAIAAAAEGLFQESALLEVPAHLRCRYFQAEARGVRVVPAIREQLHWKRTCAFGPLPERRWDMVLCRNLAIYLEPAGAKELWDSAWSSLRPGGLLMVGKADAPSRCSGFRKVRSCIFTRE